MMSPDQNFNGIPHFEAGDSAQKAARILKKSYTKFKAKTQNAPIGQIGKRL